MDAAISPSTDPPRSVVAPAGGWSARHNGQPARASGAGCSRIAAPAALCASAASLGDQRFVTLEGSPP